MIPLLILGLIQENPGAHGYELLSLMEQRHYTYIVNFTKGSFYYNIQKLEEKGYIQRIHRVESVRETQNYVITESGRQEFAKLMDSYGSKTEYINLPFYGPMLFFDDYPQADLVRILERQIGQTKERIMLLEQSIEHNTDVSRYFKLMMENSLAHHKVNLEWFEKLVKELCE
ncbi:MAG: PadR family transcriptional regulator [Culicoidibacterales bacterium]